MSNSSNHGKQPDLQTLPPTPESHPLDHNDQETLSDAPSSAESTNSRRKYQRGGRKKSTSTRDKRNSRIGPVLVNEEDEQFEAAERELVQDEPDAPIGEEPGEEMRDDPKEEYYEDEEEEEEEFEDEDEEESRPAHRQPVERAHTENVCPNCAKREKTQSPPRPQPQQTKHKAAPSSFETGIKAFNLKRAESSGGRPFGIRAQPTGKKSTESTSWKPKEEKKRRSKKAAIGDDSEEEGSVGSFEEQKQKPMSIKLDLNLMVEIFLKAKIKGEVTITFL